MSHSVVETRTETSEPSLGIARGALLNLLGQTLPLPAGLIAIPILIERLGTPRFGILSLIWAVNAYLTVFDIGFGRATTRACAVALAQDQRHLVARIVGSASAVLIVTGCAATVLLLSLSGPLASLLHVRTSLIDETRAAFMVTSLGLPAVLLSSTWRGVLEAHRRFELVAAIRTPVSTALFLIPVAILLVSDDLAAIAFGLMLVQFAGLVAYIAAARTLGIRFAEMGPPSLAQAKDLFRFGGWLTVSDIVAPILIYSDRFLISAILSPGRVAFYTAPFDVTTRLWVLPGSVGTAMFPALTHWVAEGDGKSVAGSARLGLRYVTAAVAVVAALLGAYADQLLELWIGRDFSRHSSLVLRLLLVAIVINSAAQIAHVVILAYGRSNLAARFHLAEAPLHLIILLSFINLWGIEGAAAAWLVRVSLDAGLMFTAAGRLTGADSVSLLEARLVAVVLLAGAMAVALAVLDLPPYDPVALAIMGSVLAAMWIGTVDRSDRRRLRALLFRSIGDDPSVGS